MENLGQPNGSRTAISVSQLNRQVKALLEKGLTRLWIEGEISNLARPASGHIYFSLKDSNAQIRAAFFRQRQRGPTIRFKDGDQVLAFGRVSLYEARGDYQLIVEQLEPAGEGALKRQFEVLKKKLAAEGLFDEDRKRDLPAFPKRIGVITSPSGAAVRDVLSILERRFPSIPVVVYPSAVQGDAAPAELLAALQSANERAECDVLILARGGGSLEDLWSFNDETLARAIAASTIPIISAVGHEVDFTIADFVADLRAPTPSGAAELAVPDREDWLYAVNSLARRVLRFGRDTVDDLAQTLDWLTRRLVQTSPQASLERSATQLAHLQQRLETAARRRLAEANHRLELAKPALIGTAQRRLATANHRLAIAARSLNAVSPLATLDRGYAIVEDADGKVLTSSDGVKKDTEIRARLASGELTARVTGTKS
ncbi:MAG: exodeoxyribonuclease VII large subunit [Pseudomonadota bacterium]